MNAKSGANCTAWLLAAVLLLAGGTTLAALAPEEAPAPAERDEPAEVDADAEPEADAAQPSFKFFPGSIHLSHNVNFDERGKMRSEGSSFSLSINVFYDPGITAVSYRDLTIDRIVTNTGEQLQPQNAGQQAGNIHQQHHHGGERQPRFSFSVSPTPPTRNCRSLVEISGKMKVVYSTGELRQAVLEPLAAIDGKRARIVDVPGTVVVRRDEHDLRVEFHGNAVSMLEQVRFFARNGAEIKAQYTGGGSNGQMTYRRYRGEVPDDARVVLTFFAGTRTIEVPFSVRDVPMPGAKSQDVDLVIQAPIIGPDQAIGAPPPAQGDAAAQPPAPAGLNVRRLEVQIEDGGEDN